MEEKTEALEKEIERKAKNKADYAKQKQKVMDAMGQYSTHRKSELPTEKWLSHRKEMHSQNTNINTAYRKLMKL